MRLKQLREENVVSSAQNISLSPPSSPRHCCVLSYQLCACRGRARWGLMATLPMGRCIAGVGGMNWHPGDRPGLLQRADPLGSLWRFLLPWRQERFCCYFCCLKLKRLRLYIYIYIHTQRHTHFPQQKKQTENFLLLQHSRYNAMAIRRI